MLAAYKMVSDAVNEALASDSANKGYLESLVEVQIEVHAETPDAQLVIQIENGVVEFQKTAESEKTDISISGKAINIAKLLLKPDENISELRRSGIHIEGDVTLLLELARIGKKLDIDWEALLSERIGETPAVIISRGLNQAKTISRDLLEQQKTALEGFLQNENSFVPTRSEFEIMTSRLRDLHYRLDRLEANLRQSAAKTAEEK